MLDIIPQAGKKEYFAVSSLSESFVWPVDVRKLRPRPSCSFKCHNFVHKWISLFHKVTWYVRFLTTYCSNISNRIYLPFLCSPGSVIIAEGPEYAGRRNDRDQSLPAGQENLNM